MTIDEAIQQARYVADEHSDCWRNCENIEKCCKECEYEHEQIAEWLEELKALKNGLNIKCDSLNEALEKGKKIGYNKAIDDFVKEICKMIAQSENNGNYRFYAVEIKQAIAEIAEQLKAGGKNE